MSAQHYIFGNIVLPDLLWQGDHMLGILSNPANQEFLHAYWNHVPNLPGFRTTCSGYQNRIKDPLWAQRSPEAPDSYARVQPPTGVRYEAFWIGQQQTVFLIAFPPPRSLGEPYFAAITTFPKIEYYSLERGMSGDGKEHTVFCSWSPKGHQNYGAGPSANKEAFLLALCRRLKIPEQIESPLPAQLQGASKGHVGIYGNLPLPMSKEKEAEATRLTGLGDAARDAKQFEQAEAFYREVYEMRVEAQGYENSTALLSLAPVVEMFLELGAFEDAEMTCQQWWTVCRRYLMPGHELGMIATRMLFYALQGLGKLVEAHELLQYRVHYFGLMRGKNSTQYQDAIRDAELLPRKKHYGRNSL